jgi:hypothetical protein
VRNQFHAKAVQRFEQPLRLLRWFCRHGLKKFGQRLLRGRAGEGALDSDIITDLLDAYLSRLG